MPAALPIFLFVVVAMVLAAVIILLASLVGPRRWNLTKAMPYESGVDPVHGTRRRFDVRFHLLAVAFLVFDVELLFLYPWAVAMRPAAASYAQIDSSAQGESPGETRVSTPVASATATSRVAGIDAAVSAGWVEGRDLVFGGAMLFIALLSLGFVYDWRKGVFEWRT